jgi:ribosomal protein S27AE
MQIKNGSLFLIKNVFCTNCRDVVAIESFTIEDDKLGIVLNGKCQQCGHEVARFIESE